MNYLTSKEARVEKAWNKRGLAGLRSELLLRTVELTSRDISDNEIVTGVARIVYSQLPQRDWGNADTYIAETCGLMGIDIADWASEIMLVRQGEEVLREDED